MLHFEGCKFTVDLKSPGPRMNGFLSYPEPHPHDPGPDTLFCGLVEFLVDRVGLDNALNLLTCLLETL
jgi:hypothetical protein